MAIEDRRTITQSPIHGGVIINVQGDDFMLRAPNDAQIQQASATARTYSQCLFWHEVHENQATDLADVIQRLRKQGIALINQQERYPVTFVSNY
jgi:hypothetical protein